MNKTIPIVIGVITILAGVTYTVLNRDTVITHAQIQLVEFAPVEFAPADIQFLKGSIKFATTTDEFENTIITGIKVPVKYNFPVATTTGYIIEKVDGSVEMNFGAYNQCREKGKTKAVCLSELRDDIESNVETFQINLERELEEIKSQEFQKEIKLEDL